ncbi:MAG: patatin-like phospholipase family protein, partial [Bacteroidota bacterium]
MKIRSLLSIASFLLGVVLCAQQSSPKVGLVLSGGSAHGLSHIGVLQYLEEHDIQVDYITGTSMGSIIGGLYATGMSAQEIL